jgi:acyl transferase domain-containing protein/NADPH:quinone reductase-like Zn-dependent oxidoreductase/acyl carrier protein/SAM-dependent methyltransferase
VSEKEDKIAIVGIACRFPGNATSPDKYWNLLKQGKDAVTEIEENRLGASFHLHPNKKEKGKSYTFAAGVLDDIDLFDAGFFGISPREADQMDPQQRILLELTWEALESAGMPTEALAGSNTSVSIGIASTDYGNRRLDDLSTVDPYTMTGNTQSIASNRISYVFDFKGASFSVDTACSSSLVAFHQACQSIRTGEASLAITGGVNMLLHPLPFIGFSKASMLSPNGRCKAFANDGDGYVRSEGAAILVLKPLSQAEKDGDTIHAVVLASGVNSDGKTNGLTVPSSEQQAKLLEQVYAKAGVGADEVSYIEAHGTGTSVGDPLETAALGKAIGKSRQPGHLLPIGSAKSNVGHMETASGMAGLFKIILSIKNRAIPASLHSQELNTDIDFAGYQLSVNREYAPLKSQKPLVMGVNSFGFGGTNAHVVIQEYKSTEANQRQSSKTFPPLVLSAKNADALTALAASYISLLKQTDIDSYYDIAWSAFKHRSWHENRLLVYGDDVDQIINGLTAYSKNPNTNKNAVVKVSKNKKSKLALVFSGNGCQWAGMGQSLLEDSALFRTTVEDVDRYWSEYADFSLIDEINKPATDARLELTEIAQPLLFAVQVGIVNLLRQTGIHVEGVIGHSVGEVAAGWAAGILSLKDAVRIIYERSKAQGLTKGSGRMAAVGLSREEADRLLLTLNLADDIEIAGINSPESITLSGSLKGLEQIEKSLDETVFFRILDLDYAFHSQRMDVVEEQVIQQLEGITANKGSCKFFSTVSGRVINDDDLAVSSYWWENIRKPVKFAEAMDELIDEAFDTFIEVGAHPILRTYINQCSQRKNTQSTIIPTIKREQESSQSVFSAAYQALLCRVDLDEKTIFDRQGSYVELPAYPWQKERYWYTNTAEGYDLINRKREHPLLGYRLKEPEAGWENQLDATVVSYLEDHVVDETIIFPAAGYVEMALAASSEWFESTTHEIQGLDILAPLVLEKSGLKRLQFLLDTDDGRFKIQSRERFSHEAWTINAVGRLKGKVWKKPDNAEELIPVNKDCLTIQGSEHYQLTHLLGLEYGPAFKGVDRVCCWKDHAVAELKSPLAIHATFIEHQLHPSLLDACFQLLVDLLKADIDDGHRDAMIPIQVGTLRLYQSQQEVVYASVALKKRSPRSVLADYTLFDQQKNIIAELENCRFRSVNFSGNDKVIDSFVYERVFQSRYDDVTYRSFPKSAVSESANDVLVNKLFDSWKNYKQHERETFFTAISPLFDVLVTAYVKETFEQIGLNDFTLDELFSQTSIDAKHKKFIVSLLSILQEDDFVSLENDRWTFHANDELPPSRDIWQSIVSEKSDLLPETLLIGRCGEHLYDYLKGEVSTEALLQPKNSSTFEHWLNHSTTFDALHAGINILLQEILSTWPVNKAIRVAVIGARNADWLESFIKLLTGFSVEILILDEKEHIANQTDEIYGHLSHVNIKSSTLAVDDLMAVDEFQKGFFDIVVVNQSLSFSDHPNELLQCIHHQLAIAGKLIMLELQPDRFINMTLGLAEDWWLADIDQPIVHPTLPTASGWKSLLEDTGFDDIHTLFEPADITKHGAVLSLASVKEHAVITDNNHLENVDENWLLFSESSGLSFELANRLKALCSASGIGVKHTLIDANSGFEIENNEHWSSVWQEQDNTHRVVHLVGWDSASIEAHSQTLSAIKLVQSLRNEQLTQPPQVSFITLASGSISNGNVNKTELNPLQAAMWGLGRVMMNEYPELKCRLLDWEGATSSSDDIQRMAVEIQQEVISDSDENEVMLDGISRTVSRMRQTSFTQEISSVNTDVCLDFSTPGQFKNLYWRALPEQALQPNEIEIKPLATGLNFRDIMYAMGLLADEAVENGFAGASLGLELSGVVTRVGESVSAFSVGDAVIGFAPACFSSRVITQTTAVAHKPASWSFEEAATVPTTFFTAYYALTYLAQMQKGESILIHGASGGVGLAAIQIAQYLGLAIFATAGTEEKRDYLKMLGVEHVLDSRTLEFADEIMQRTEGEGVDAVLNVISGEVINRNLDILKPFGRFLEIGKRDFYENTRIGLRPFRNNISYFGIDADQLLIERPTLANKLFNDMMTLFNDEILRPLPFRVYKADHIEHAFRQMQQSRHIGKVVVSFASGHPAPTSDQLKPKKDTFKCRPNMSYLVTGGVSGFGLKTACWLADRGAESLVLVSRSAKPDEQAKQTIKQLQDSGIHVSVMACDVSNTERVNKLIADIEASSFPLSGVVHAAMVLDDGLIQKMDAKQYQRVFSPKALGGWNLHKHTEHLDLDVFLMFSSATTYIGNPGQGNYVAANSYLEALSHYRQKQGLVASYIAWGAIDDVGYLSKNTDTKDALQSRLGGKAINSTQALEVLDHVLMDQSLAGVAHINMDWGSIRKLMPAALSPKYTEQIRRNQTAAGNVNQDQDVLSMIEQLSEEDARNLIKEKLLDEIAKILRQEKDALDLNISVTEMGMDSLMGMELVAAVEGLFQIKLPIMLISEGASINKLVDRITQQLKSDDDSQDNVRDFVTHVITQQGEALSTEAIDTIVNEVNKAD